MDKCNCNLKDECSHPVYTSELFEKIRSARDAIDKAIAVECTCSGLVLKYEGCLCEKAKSIASAKQGLKAILAAL